MLTTGWLLTSNRSPLAVARSKARYPGNLMHARCSPVSPNNSVIRFIREGLDHNRIRDQPIDHPIPHGVDGGYRLNARLRFVDGEPVAGSGQPVRTAPVQLPQVAERRDGSEETSGCVHPEVAGEAVSQLDQRIQLRMA